MGSVGWGVAAHRHVCFAYDDPATLAAHAGAFLSTGDAAGDRIWYVGAERLPTIPASARFFSVSAVYPPGAVIDPPVQAAEYAGATRAAREAGYAGLRVVAEVTALVRTPAQLDAFARYEFLADQLVCAAPFAAMCAYDRRELGDRTVAELATLHARTNADVPFRLSACPPSDGSAALAGELDLSTDELLATALARAEPRPIDGAVVLNAAELRFVDHRTLILLDSYAARRDVPVVLRAAGAAVARLAGLLDLARLRVETAR